jgi:hypothetical protein
MDEKLKQVLPTIAVFGALLALISLVILSVKRQEILEDTGETQSSVEGTLAEIQTSQPNSINDQSFQEAITQAEGALYIANLWVFSPTGEILQGNQAFNRGSVKQLSTEETKRILATLSGDILSDEQQIVLAAASVMQAEGEHNDVYRHILREVRAADDKLVALVGASYDVNPSVGTSPGVVWILLILCIVAGLSLYWFSLPIWVWLDARTRGERHWVWAIFVLFGNLVALIAYILARVPQLQRVSNDE